MNILRNIFTMNPNNLESYQRSNKLYKDILLKTREKIIEEYPPYLHPTKDLEIVNTNKIAVIIDPRYDELMEAVILNFMHFMVPEGWIFMIGCVEQYREQIQTRFPQSLFIRIDTNLIYYDENHNPNISIDTYNNILCDTSFWNQIPCENVAIFQKDCIMYRMFTEDWAIKYAYTGAFWYTDETSLTNGVINGGFSIRKKSAMLECINHVTWKMIELYRKNVYTCHEYFPIKRKNEDIFFTYACEILKYPLAPIYIRKQLATESEYFTGTSVYHGWNKIGYQTEILAIQILSHSPLFSKYLPEVLNSEIQPLIDPPTPSNHTPIDTQPPEKENNDPPQPPPSSDTEITVFHLPNKSEPEIRFI